MSPRQEIFYNISVIIYRYFFCLQVTYHDTYTRWQFVYIGVTHKHFSRPFPFLWKRHSPKLERSRIKPKMILLFNVLLLRS